MEISIQSRREKKNAPKVVMTVLLYGEPHNPQACVHIHNDDEEDRNRLRIRYARLCTRIQQTTMLWSSHLSKIFPRSTTRHQKCEDLSACEDLSTRDNGWRGNQQIITANTATDKGSCIVNSELTIFITCP
jgi:hypothetical protein